MRDERGDQCEGGRDVDEQPDFEPGADADVPPREAQRCLLAFEQQDDLVEPVGAIARDGGQQLGESIERATVAAAPRAARQALDQPAAEPRSVDRSLDGRCLVAGQREGGIVELTVDRGDIGEHLPLGDLAAVAAERGGQPVIRGDAVQARPDDDHHQRVSKRVDVPAEQEAGMEGADDDEAEAEIDVGAGPRLQRPPPRRNRALAKPQ